MTTARTIRVAHQEECKTTALRWLTRLRAGVTHNYNNYIEYMRHALQDGNLSLEDAGTTPEELEDLQILGCRTTALWYLARMRHTLSTEGIVSPSDMKSFKEELREGHLLHHDVDVTRDERSKLERATRIVRKLNGTQEDVAA